MSTKTLIQTISVGVGGAASIDFTSIPATYDDLSIEVSARAVRAANLSDALQLIFNGSGGTAYSDRSLRGDGTSVTSFSDTGVAFMYGGRVPAATATANVFGNILIYIPNYAGANYKSVSIDSVIENNAATSYAELIAGLWASASAITSLSIADGNASTFAQYSVASLYGIKNS